MDIETIQKIKEKFDKCILPINEKGCIEWTGTLNADGYGYIFAGKKNMGAHRAAYLIKHGDIPYRMQICHSCDNRKCVNVDHLWAGNAKDNMQDMSLKRRYSKGNIGRQAKLWYVIYCNNKLDHDINLVIEKFKATQDELRAKLLKQFQTDPDLLFDLPKKVDVSESKFTDFIVNNVYLNCEIFMKIINYIERD